LSVNRPILVVVLKDCVTETNETPWESNVSTSLAKSASERVVEEIGGRPPEAFDTIAARYVAASPLARRGFAATLREGAGLMATLMVRAPNIKAIETRFGVRALPISPWRPTRRSGGRRMGRTRTVLDSAVCSERDRSGSIPLPASSAPRNRSGARHAQPSPDEACDTGLVPYTYVTLHFANHALGNISVWATRARRPPHASGRPAV
jgi:hypothetical protein